MKNLLALLLIFAFALNIQAQDTVKVDLFGKNVVSVSEDTSKAEVILLNNRINIHDNFNNDTTTIRIGNKNIEIVENNNTTQIDIERDESWKSERENHKKRDFNGHWAGLELGVNSFYNNNYSLYGGEEFMELSYPKSLEVNLNFAEFNISLKKDRIGIVTGMGWSIKNYKFDSPITIDNINGMIEPIDIEPDNLKKSKLTVSYLTVPLLMEFQIPINGNSNQLYISGGVIGGLNMGSHTKIKHKKSKSKDHESFNINPFQYSATGRIGLKNISLYGTYSLSPLFKDNRGPELFPFSIGLSLINF